MSYIVRHSGSFSAIQLYSIIIFENLYFDMYQCYQIRQRSLVFALQTSRSILIRPKSPLVFSPTTLTQRQPFLIMSEKRRRVSSSVSQASDSQQDVFHVAGLQVDNHRVNVPLDYSDSSSEGKTISIFYRVVSLTCNNKPGVKPLPFLVYLQGGPGFEGPRPVSSFGWIKSALNHYTVVLLDQRGTGLSHGLSCDLLERAGGSAAALLKCFRADSIVRDCEVVREDVISKYCQHVGGDSIARKWSLLGQSYGGFCCMTYLSMFPDSLQNVFLTGGVPPGIDMECPVDMVYMKTFQKVIIQNKKFYARFPGAVAMAQDVVRHLCSCPDGRVVTPSGNYLTPRSFQLLGLSCLGFSNGFERLYYMLENAFDVEGNLSYKFLKEFDTTMAWDSNPLYAIMHESIYCQGKGSSRWAAHRIRESMPQLNRLFNAVTSVSTNAPVYFTGEMVFPWMFDDFAQLRKIKDAANEIASCSDWSQLYNVEVLEKNTVSIAAACYYEDMFVSFDLSQETLQKVGSTRQYITNEYLHDGIREQGALILEKLFQITHGGTVLR